MALLGAAAISDLTGLQESRLTLMLQLSMRKKIIASQSILFSVGLDGVAALYDFCDIIAESVAEEVLYEIKAHSKLMPLSTDVGIAGAGIITGWTA